MMKRLLLMSGALVVLSGAPVALATGTSTPPRPVGESGAQLLAEGTGGAAAQVLDQSPVVNADGSVNASKLIGLDVKSPNDEKVGDIGEIVLAKEGEIEGVVVDVGGFLGIASRPVLLGWSDLQMIEQDGKATVIANVSKDHLEQMPAYEGSRE